MSVLLMQWVTVYIVSTLALSVGEICSLKYPNVEAISIESFMISDTCYFKIIFLQFVDDLFHFTTTYALGCCGHNSTMSTFAPTLKTKFACVDYMSDHSRHICLTNLCYGLSQHLVDSYRTSPRKRRQCLPPSRTSKV